MDDAPSQHPLIFFIPAPITQSRDFDEIEI